MSWNHGHIDGFRLRSTERATNIADGCCGGGYRNVGDTCDYQDYRVYHP